MKALLLIGVCLLVGSPWTMGAPCAAPGTPNSFAPRPKHQHYGAPIQQPILKRKPKHKAANPALRDLGPSS